MSSPLLNGRPGADRLIYVRIKPGIMRSDIKQMRIMFKRKLEIVLLNYFCGY